MEWQSYHINEAVNGFPAGHDAGIRTAFPSCKVVMYIKDKNKITYPGISLNFDAVINGGGSFYADSRARTTIYIDIGFHHISNSSVYPDNTWYWVNDVAQVCVLDNPLVHSGTWGYADEKYSRSIKPYYGWQCLGGSDPRNWLYEEETGTAGSGTELKKHYYTDSEIKNMNYNTVISILERNGAIPVNRSGGAKDSYNDFMNPETIGIRYMSNGIRWNKDFRHQPGYSYSLSSSSNPGYSKDPGPGNNLINISARAGVGHDRYCIRLRMDSNHAHSNIWYHPTGTNFKVDNALLGIPDYNSWSGNSAPENWPERYDAHFEHKNGSWKKIEAAGKYKKEDWQVF